MLPVSTISAGTESNVRTEFREWYPLYRKRSIKSRVIPVPANFISYLFDEDSIVLPNGVSASGTLVDQLSDDEDAHEIEGGNDASQDERFHDLNRQLRSAIDDLGGLVFVKLNSVAPTDAKWINGGSLKCVNLEQIYLLLKSSTKVSEFIQDVRTISLGDGENGDFYVTLRKWSNLHPAMEFRCFIKAKTLIGASQRDCSCHFDFLLRDREDIEETLACFVDEILSSEEQQCPYSSFICDIYVDKAKKCYILDINDFSVKTESLLYTWEELLSASTEREAYTDAFELRVVESSDQIIPSSATSSFGPIEAVDVAAGSVAGFGDWRSALRLDRASDENIVDLDDEDDSTEHENT